MEDVTDLDALFVAVVVFNRPWPCPHQPDFDFDALRVRAGDLEVELTSSESFPWCGIAHTILDDVVWIEPLEGDKDGCTEQPTAGECRSYDLPLD